MPEVLFSEKSFRELLLPNKSLFKINERFFSVFDERKRKSNYDTKAKFYDYFASNIFLNKIILGNSTENYNRFCEEGIEAEPKGFLLDAGCGSLLFTARAYSSNKRRKIVLLDRSLEMLNKAYDRLVKLNGKIPENIFLLQADIFSLPFSENTFSIINSHGILHLFKDVREFFSSLNFVLKENGKIFILVILSENLFGKIITQIAHFVGEFGFSKNSEELSKLISDLGFNVKIKTIGNMGYLEINKISGK